jgi:hypothetical protein
MIVTNYTPEDLKKLPLRAIVALSARCARRVEHLAVPADDRLETQRCRAAVANAILLAENFANGSPCSPAEVVVTEIEEARALANGDFVRDSALATIETTARAVANALHAFGDRSEAEKSSRPGSKADPLQSVAELSADLTARSAFTAAFEAVAAQGHTDAFIKAAIADFEKLLRLDLGTYPNAGTPVDTSSRGPLGALDREGLTQ